MFCANCCVGGFYKVSSHSALFGRGIYFFTSCVAHVFVGAEMNPMMIKREMFCLCSGELTWYVDELLGDIRPLGGLTNFDHSYLFLIGISLTIPLWIWCTLLYIKTLSWSAFRELFLKSCYHVAWVPALTRHHVVRTRFYWLKKATFRNQVKSCSQNARNKNYVEALVLLSLSERACDSVFLFIWRSADMRA